MLNPSPPFLLLQVVSLDQAYAGRVVHPAHNGSVAAGREILDESRFEIVGRRNRGGLDLFLLAAAIRARLPVVVRSNQGTAAIAQLQGGIAQSAGNRDRWSERADQHSGRPDTTAAPDNQAADHDVIACVHKASCADVCQLRVRALPEIVNFDQAHAVSPCCPARMTV